MGWNSRSEKAELGSAMYQEMKRLGYTPLIKPRYQIDIENGVCTRCRSHRADYNYRLCQACKQAELKESRDRYHKHKEQAKAMERMAVIEERRAQRERNRNKNTEE